MDDLRFTGQHPFTALFVGQVVTGKFHSVLFCSYFRAALGGHAYICQMLIKFGVDPNVRDYTG